MGALLDIIIDSNMTFAEAVEGTAAPQKILNQMEFLNLQYISTDGMLHQGQMMVNKGIAKDILEIFAIILEVKFPIHKIVPMSFYGWDDNKSMEDNNTSSFCYRKVLNKDKLSLHSFGMAVDINPIQNPLVYSGAINKTIPAGAIYDINNAGTLIPDSYIVQAFLERGFRWGADFEEYSDYQHFYKEV